MRTTITTIIIIILTSTISHAQDKQTENGLKYGMWSEKQYNGTAVGKYKIVSINDCDTIRGGYTIYTGGKISYPNFMKNIGWKFCVNFKETEQHISSKVKVSDKIFVKDSIWNIFNTEDIAIESSLYDNGIEYEHRKFDSTGGLISRTYTNFENKTFYSDTYKDGRVFKRYYRKVGDFSSSVTIFYPEDNLSFFNCILVGVTDFLKPVNFDVSISSNEGDTISEIIYSSDNIRIDKISDKIIFKPKDKLDLNIEHLAKRERWVRDSIILKTNSNTYKILVNTEGLDINKHNIDTIKQIELYKEPGERCLLFLGQTTGHDIYYLYKNKTDEKPLKTIMNHDTVYNGDMDLTDLPSGIYYIKVMTEEVTKWVELILH